MSFTPNTRPKSQRIAKEKLGRLLQLGDLEDNVTELVRDLIPQAWHRLEHDIDVEEPKVKITLRVDRSVAKFYRAWGNGYQARINRILATYAQARIADYLTIEKDFYKFVVEETLDKYNDPVPDDIEEGPQEGEV
ncbi:BrnA antitoxin of type II toxin-antitoxin system [Litoreibacter meonggei]|uniref:BrnA antitoxin of type II toxin-antitoxin system n=1 Tax=Litoreibacter meonggei TaxID=1049199 RepID=A0A497W5H3_9RHOB|nr:BrnA antitoxin family protein [Litoreibacter meonggei]RLJ51681.1 BrnA antitoxin of type II toxin-antitoxin system [Litoreibacter meonggei]